MGRGIERGGQQTRTSAERVYAELGFSRQPKIEHILASYLKLPAPSIGLTPRHQLHYDATGYVLGQSFGKYYQDYQDVMSAPRVSKNNLALVKKDFGTVLESAKKINFPKPVLAPYSFNFIDFSINDEKAIPKDIRDGATRMGFSIGPGILDNERIERLKRHYEDAINKDGRLPLSEDETRAAFAKSILDRLGVPLDVIRKPSVTEVATDYAQKHARSIALKAAIVGIAGSVFAPTVANAAEPAPPSIATVQGTTQTINTISVAPSVETTDSAPAPTVIAPVPAQPVTMSVGVSLSPDTKSDIEKQAPAPSIQATTPVAPEAALSVVPTVTQPDKGASQTVEMTPAPITSDQTSTEVVAPVVAVAPANPDIPLNADGTPVEAPVPTIAPEVPVVLVDPNATPLTPNQESAQSIVSTLDNDGDIPSAVAAILSDFRSKTEAPTNADSNNPQYAVTNPDLVKNIQGLEATYTALIQANGHSDVNNINTSLVALAVLHAAGNDGTVLNDQNVLDMVKGVTAPTDAYQAKLFATYLAQAKTTLEAKDDQGNEVLLTGIDPKYQAQVETIYAYALMANVSDTDQATAIQTMKDADAKAAAEAKAAADAEAAKKAAEANPGSQTPEQEAVQDLIDNSSGVEQEKYQAIQFFINKGLKPMQAAAIVGNLTGESGMDSSKKQYYGGPGRFLAQWTLDSGRYNGLVAYAKSQNKPVTDFNVQLEYIWIELSGNYKYVLDDLQAAQNLTDGVSAVQTKYEVTYASIHRIANPTDFINERDGRVNLIKGEYNNLTDKITSITQARAAAAADAAAKAKSSANLTALIDKTVAAHTNARHKYVGPHSPTAAFGNCTDGVNELEALIGNPLPGSLGDGKNYNTSLQKDGYASDSSPHVGDVANTTTFTTPGNTHGHVGVVESVNSDGSFVLEEMNHTYFNGFDTRTISADVAKNQFHFTKPNK